MKQAIAPFDPDGQMGFIRDSQVRSQAIYRVVLGLTLGSVLSLPFVAVPVTVQDRGIIRPVTEIAEIRVIPSAQVTSVLAREGQRVRKGDTLMLLETEGLERRISLEAGELERISSYVDDLTALTGGDPPENFRSGLYRTQFEDFRNRLLDADLKLERANRQVGRQKPLIDNQLISERDYEEEVFLRNQLESERRIIRAAQLARWRSELAARGSERDGCMSRLSQLERQREQYIIRSPVTGTLEAFEGIYPGCNLQAGQVVAEVSPDSGLVAEVYVPARHIGMLFPGMPAIVQVDAFDHNRWGSVPARITGISGDYHLVDNVPVFRVKCELAAPDLRLRNGATGTVRKGMTLNARFILAQRTLLQLLWQKTDGWLNPAMNRTR